MLQPRVANLTKYPEIVANLSSVDKNIVDVVVVAAIVARDAEKKIVYTHKCVECAHFCVEKR